MNKDNKPGQPGGIEQNSKDQSLQPARRDPTGQHFTTDQGVRLPHTDDSLKAGARGPTLMEDFHFREKITHFDHERIPERVVHARGSAAHGVFQVYQSMAEYTSAGFLQDPTKKTPVFVRFSTVVGSRGSADTARDVRGFATRFYTEEGNFDVVGNNIPVFFIQDGIKFPDVVHAVKPEPHNEIPQAASAHDTFWDFVSLVPETMHMVMWVLSDRAIPRSFRMMEGFGVHTFRLVNAQGRARFVKFHWKPLLGVHSLVWDEAQKIAGKDPDFHRRDLWEAIAEGDFPEYELGVQIIEEEDEHKFAFDLLDATKIVPEELVPVQRVGKMTLNRNPDNFFAETEQVAFHLGNLVPGIDVTNDPLLQARLFSYLDTQLLRLGGPNFTQIPINRPIVPVHNHEQDGFMRQTIERGRAHYHPNTLGGGCPMMASREQGGYVHHAERVEGHKIRQRSPSFQDHYSQATLFWNSLSVPEQQHLIEAGRFELGKVESLEIRQRVVTMFRRVDEEFGRQVAAGVGVAVSAPGPSGGTAAQKAAEAVKETVEAVQDTLAGRRSVDRSPMLSMAGTVKNTIKSRRIAFLVAAGYNHGELQAVRTALENAGAHVKIVSQHLGPVTSAAGGEVQADMSLLTTGSVLFDAVFVPGGRGSVEQLKQDGDALHFLAEAFKHCKAIGATGEGIELLAAAWLPGVTLAAQGVAGPPASDRGVVTAAGASDLGAFAQAFAQAIAQHRHWQRTEKARVPA
jgi:catalase